MKCKRVWIEECKNGGYFIEGSTKEGLTSGKYYSLELPDIMCLIQHLFSVPEPGNTNNAGDTIIPQTDLAGKPFPAGR